MAKIECERCGNCCPWTCSALKKDKESGLATCSDHPSIKGREFRSWLCQEKPAMLYCWGIACQAVIHAIAEKYGPVTYKKGPGYKGQIKIVSPIYDTNGEAIDNREIVEFIFGEEKSA